MKTREMSQDEFAKFIAKVILDIDNYSFDVLYDIKKIIIEFNDNRGKHETPIFDNYHFMVRNTGSDMIHADDGNYSIYDDRSSVIYSLTFCWNGGYFSNIPFCKVEQIR